MLIGPSVEELKAALETQINMKFRLQRRNGAMDTRKVAEAEKVLDKRKSPLLEREAALRGITVEQLADIVMGMAAETEEIELMRVQAVLRLREQTDHMGMIALARELQIDIQAPQLAAPGLVPDRPTPARDPGPVVIPDPPAPTRPVPAPKKTAK